MSSEAVGDLIEAGLNEPAAALFAYGNSAAMPTADGRFWGRGCGAVGWTCAGPPWLVTEFDMTGSMADLRGR